MLGSWGLGGDEFSGVGVDVVEVGVVVVVVVGVVRRHLLDAAGDAPHRLHVRLRGRPAPRPPPFAPASPQGSHALSCLSPGAHGALALALGSFPGPNASVPLSVPWVPLPVSCALACTAGARALPVPVPMPLAAPTLAHRSSLRSMCPVAARLGALPAWRPSCSRPCALFPCPDPFPAPCPASRRPLPALCPPPLLLASAPRPSLRPRSLLRVPWPAPCVCPWAPPLWPPVPRSALLWLAPCPACALPPPSWITRRASRCLCSCGSLTPGGKRSGAGGRTCCFRPGEKGLGGNGLGGLVWVWVGLVWARYFAPSLPTAAAAAAPGEAPGARAGSVPRVRGMLGAVAWLAEDVARPAGAAVSTPRALSPSPSAAAAAPGEAPGSCGGATPRAGGAPGAAVGAAARLAGAALSAPRAPGAPSRDAAAGLAAWAAGAVSSAGAGPWVDSPVLAEAARGCLAGGPTGTAASASLRSSRSSGLSPAHPGETGERERDRRWWRSSRWGEPSESDITVILVGTRGGRCALLTTSRCISVVPWAVLCSALRGGGGEGVGGRRWCQRRTGGGRWPSIGTGKGGGGATRPTRRATAPSPGWGSGPWAPGGRRVVPGGAAVGGPP